MKKLKLITSILLIFVLLFGINFSSRAANLSGGAEGLILIEGDSLRILYEHNKDARLPMASTTKIMTAILAIENGNLSDVIEVSSNASGTEGSSIWLGVGEHMTLEDMLYGLMLSSGNDAAVAVAEHVGGSVEGFVEMMNKKAAELGCSNTHFVNPNGLYNKDHYTSAYDLAIITAYAMKNETFRNIVSTQSKEITWEGHEYNRVLKNKNRNLWQYDGSTGVKTGYTIASGRCFVASAKRDGMELICVMLNDYEMFDHSREVLDYGFTNYKKINIVNGGEFAEMAPVVNGTVNSFKTEYAESFSLPLTNDERKTIKKTLTIDQNISAPVAKGAKVGSLEISVLGNTVKTVDVVASEDVLENTYEYNLGKILDRFFCG